MNADAMRLALELGNWVVTAFLAVAVFLTRRQTAKFAQQETTDNEQDQEIANLKNRVTRIEGEMRHAPSHDDLTKIHDKLNQMLERSASTESTVKAVERQVGRMDSYLRGNRT